MSTSNTPASLSNDAIWNSLKQAIAASSGFKRWQQEKHAIAIYQGCTLDQLVSYYLRETLETLAY
jgi:hypothetical protein